MQINDLLNVRTTAENAFIEYLGYDRAEFVHFKIDDDQIVSWTFTLEDDFQCDLPFDKKVHNDYMYRIETEIDNPIGGLFAYINRMPNREQRELEVTCRRLTEMLASTEDLRSEMVNAFVRRLQPDLDELRRQLVDLRGEVPF